MICVSYTGRLVLDVFMVDGAMADGPSVSGDSGLLIVSVAVSGASVQPSVV
ncbi:MAG: hypothetical protein LBN10_03395 [Propionibacteriaceae bacterium]|nr:hypothetical protein [Propionibacteriaceae bacterium]